MKKRLSSRQLRQCEKCDRRKNLQWDIYQKLCHECLVERKQEIINLHHENKIVYEVAEKEMMERFKMNRLEAEKLIHPPLTMTGKTPKIKPLGQVIEWDENGELKNV